MFGGEEKGAQAAELIGYRQVRIWHPGLVWGTIEI